MQQGKDFWGYNPSLKQKGYGPSSPRKPSLNLLRKQQISVRIKILIKRLTLVLESLALGWKKGS